MDAPRTLNEAWNRTVRLRRESPAIFDAASELVWTCEALDLIVQAWRTNHGAAVAGHGVAFAEANGAAWLRSFLGVISSGGVAIPLDPGEPAAALPRAAAAAGASFLWSERKLEFLGAVPPWTDGRRVVKLTSGSTGVPRALAFTDAQLLADGRAICASMGIRPADINLGLIPFGHSYGLGNLVVPLLLQGTAIVSSATALPQAVADRIERTRPTVFPAVPALLRALVETSVDPAQLASLRTVISAGAPLPAEIAQKFHRQFGLKPHGFYGSSETGGISYDRTGAATLAGRSVGRPLRGVRLALGAGGRLSVASPAVFTLGNRRRRQGLGVHSPADRVRLDPRGELVLLGRTGRVVKLAGRRLNLGEVESVLRSLAGVQDALVSLHAGRSDALAAAVAGQVTADFVRDALRERVAAWKIPKRIIVLEAFPVTARGKTDTRRLGELLDGPK